MDFETMEEQTSLLRDLISKQAEEYGEDGGLVFMFQVISKLYLQWDVNSAMELNRMIDLMKGQILLEGVK